MKWGSKPGNLTGGRESAQHESGLISGLIRRAFEGNSGVTDLEQHAAETPSAFLAPLDEGLVQQVREVHSKGGMLKTVLRYCAAVALSSLVSASAAFVGGPGRHYGTNYAGYAKRSVCPCTSVQDTFRVPFSQVSVMNPHKFNASAEWVGIQNIIDGVTVQCGIITEITAAGVVEAAAFYEIPPRGAIPLNETTYPVKPNDLITANVTCNTNCDPGQAGQIWTCTLTDMNARTGAQNWQYVNKSLARTLNEDQADFIFEDLNVLGVGCVSTVCTPPNFGTSPVKNATVNGANANFQYPLEAYYSVHAQDDVYVSQPTASGDSFTYCYGVRQKFPTCSAPTVSSFVDAARTVNFCGDVEAYTYPACAKSADSWRIPERESAPQTRQNLPSLPPAPTWISK